MALVPKIVVVLLAIIAAEEGCDASSEGGQAQPENPWKKFWQTHKLLWTLRTSDTIFYQCQRQQFKDSNESGVMLTLLGFFGERVSTDYFWTFNTDGSMSRGHEDMLQLKAVLEYDSPENKCGVVKVEEWWYHTETTKKAYEETCKKDNSTWCTCNSIAHDTKPNLCLNNPVYELVNYGEPTEDAPQDCTDEYNSKRKVHRPTDNKVYEKDCEKK